MNSLKRGSNKETQRGSGLYGKCLQWERKYTHNSHLFIIRYINIILSKMLFVSFGVFAIVVQDSN
jgi:hypothetical protein